MKKISLGLVFVAFLSLSACQSTGPLKVNEAVDLTSNTNISYVNKAALLEEQNIKLPNNYDVTTFGVVRIAAYVNNIRWKNGAESASIDTNIVGKLLENELARTKRFSVMTRLCSSCNYELAHQQQNGLAAGAMEPGAELNPDYILEVDIDFGMSVKNLYDHNEVIFYSVATTKLINPTTKETINAFPPIRKNLVAKNFTEMNGRIINGFDYNDPKEKEQAYKDAAQKAIAVLASQIIDYYPVGGRVINYRAGRLAIDAGIDQGFAIKQPVVLFLSDDGLDIPLASAEITPKRDGGAGVILKWRSDQEAVRVKKKIDALGKDYLKQVEIYAVSVGTPADWVY
jgi:hypothetical protein